MKLLISLFLLAASSTFAAGAPARVAFDWFEYSGRDAIFDAPLPANSFRNPILAGFHPDPTICRVGDDYYLANSSFCYFPGIPLFHSRDLVNWTPVGHVITRPSQAKFDGLGISRGVFAPALSFHNGTFYLVTTLVDAGGNCFFTAKDPTGPWSDPIWLREVDGIDPSFFFDRDGRAWLVNNGPPPDNRPLYNGHRAIWLQEFDVAQQKLVGPRAIIVNGGTDLAKHPIWIEGPHLFRRGDWYYLMCAEGGTAEAHSEVIFRSHDVSGPWEPWAGNPILTQRDLPAKRTQPITSTGHADLVETQAGEWWAVFLGCRPYDEAARQYNTGRETFMLPVTWTNDGWPMILDHGKRVPEVVQAPRIEGRSGLRPDPRQSLEPLTGNFTWRDDFDAPRLAPLWNSLRAPADAWLSPTQKPGVLVIEPQTDALTSRGRPAFVGRRIQHADFTATTRLQTPLADHLSAGLAAFQNETHHFYLGVRRRGQAVEVFLERANGKVETVVTATLPPGALIDLRIAGRGARIEFAFAERSDEWTTLKADDDGSILSTAVAGGFVGSYVGLHARLEP
jgi:xylan 1,4-beta-xylosidase